MIAIPDVLYALQPRSAAAFQAALSTVLPFSDANLLQHCHRQLSAAQRRTVSQAPDNCSALERAVSRFADQFAVSVDGISDTQVAELTELMDEQAVNALANAVYLLDMGLRLELVVPKVLHSQVAADGQTVDVRSVEASVSETVDQDEVIASVIAEFAAQAVLADEVDPVTSELVRLRCAQTHHCRLCGSLRQRSALDAGLQAGVAEIIARYESSDFAAHQVAALHLCDALILNPADADGSLREELEEHFSPSQIAEICFDAVKWSQQKALVALGSDAPPWEGVHVLDFDAAGHPVFAGPLA